MKIVMKVEMNCGKCRTKALQIATQADGAEFVGFDEKRQDELIVTGKGVDAVKIVGALRKKVGKTSLISVEDDVTEPKA
ncbi:hypothetical protein ACJRO7_022196 [Eucalyptus globulus]|uniref:HMA domain-containing protein n=1 Tax=Eucalyptus globulus TaxID=34317 RepID=A0ABD3KTY0_EUCGL